MITKKEAKEKNLKIINGNIENETLSLIEKIKAILPNLVNSDNVVDIEAIKDLIDITSTTANNKGYELTFGGKGIAKYKYQTETDKALKVNLDQSKDFEDTNNMIIRGDNLDALKILKQNYNGKIKMIYIDPPYNTKTENFVYADDFRITDEQFINELCLGDDTINYLENIYGNRSHSGWLSFIYPRLKLARDLLADDGVIFISIDDNEQANLKILCDEIFGEDNFLTDIIWNSTKSVTNTAIISTAHTHTHTYFKNKEYFIKNRTEFRIKEDGEGFHNPDNDPRGSWKADPFQVGGWRPNQQYDIINPNTKRVYKPNEGCSWKNDFSKFKKLLDDNRIIFGLDGLSSPQRKRFLSESMKKGKVVKSIWDNVGTTTSGTKYLKKLFNGKSVFTNPKSIELLKRIIELSTKKDSIILDFFAGSGTTADAVMQLNIEDGGNRQFILVQWDEHIHPEKSKTAHDFCKDNKLDPVISSITIERINRAGEKIKKDNPLISNDLDIGYKVFTLTDKQKIVEDDNGQLSVVLGDLNTIDRLYNMMAKSSKILTSKIETLEKDRLYKIDNCYYVLDNFKMDINTLKSSQIYIDAYSNISLESWLNFDISESENVIVIY